jgi:drug/metabolite transporter (DMT)-like permease
MPEFVCACQVPPGTVAVVPDVSPQFAAGEVSGRSGRAKPTSPTWLFIVLPGLIWGSSFLFIAEGLTAMRPAGITFVRTTIGFVTLTFVPSARRPVAPQDRWRVRLLGIIWMAFPMSMFPFAEQHVTSALTGLLNGATPLFVAVVGALLVRQVPTKAVRIALGVGLAGVMLIAAPSLGDGGNSMKSVGLIAIALVSYGVSLNVARPLQQRNGALPVVWRAVAVAALATAPTGVPAVLDAHWTWSAALSMLALGALGTALANVLVATAAGRTSASSASAMAFLIPAVSLVLGVAIRHESVRVVSIAGGAVCMIGAWLLARAGRPRG